MPETQNVHFSPEDIKALRKRTLLNQRDFADLFDVSQVAVSEWERGLSTPTSPRMAAMQQLSECLDELDEPRAKRWIKELLDVAATAGIYMVLSTLFGGPKPM